MILNFVDTDGDPVAVDSVAIVALSVGRVSGPRALPSEDQAVVTLIHLCHGSPLLVADAYADVHRAWETARLPELAEAAPTALPIPHWPSIENERGGGL